MIPLRDENPSRSFPFVNYGLIAVNILVFLWQQTSPDLEVYRHMMIPAAITGSGRLAPEASLHPVYLSIFSAMFMHANLMHIGGNMLYLWIFGDNIEDMLGHVRYLLFYLAGGVAASAAHIMLAPTSTVPTLGASGAIAAVLGAYLVTHGGARVLCIITLGIFWMTRWIPAWVVLGFWILLQLVALPGSLTSATGGVAYAAHVGGFLAGMVLIFLFGGRSHQRAPARRDGWGHRDYGY